MTPKKYSNIRVVTWTLRTHCVISKMINIYYTPCFTEKQKPRLLLYALSYAYILKLPILQTIWIYKSSLIKIQSFCFHEMYVCNASLVTFPLKSLCFVQTVLTNIIRVQTVCLNVKKICDVSNKLQQTTLSDMQCLVADEVFVKWLNQ